MTINNIEMEQVNNKKFLGIIIDNKLIWKPHRQKISQKVGILHKMKGVINKNSLYILYCSLLPLLKCGVIRI